MGEALYRQERCLELLIGERLRAAGGCFLGREGHILASGPLFVYNSYCSKKRKEESVQQLFGSSPIKMVQILRKTRPNRIFGSK